MLKTILMQTLKIVLMSMFQCLPLPWIMEQTYAISKWCLSRMKVNFVEEPETMFDDLREIGPTFFLLGT